MPMRMKEVRELFTEAQLSLVRIGTAEERPADREIVSKVLKAFGAEAMKLATRNLISVGGR